MLKTEGGDGVQVVHSALEGSQIKFGIPWPPQPGGKHSGEGWGGEGKLTWVLRPCADGDNSICMY